MESTALATTQPAAPVFGYMQLIQLAMEKSDLDKVEKMMELKAKHDASEAKKAFDHAVALFKSRKPTVVKNKKGHNGTAYASLDQIVAKSTPILSECGLTHSWSTESNPRDKIVSVTCKLTHVSGHFEQVSLSSDYDGSGNKNPIQSMASAITYLERYTFMAITGLSASDTDDDGNSAGAKPLQTTSQLQLYMLAGDQLGVYLYGSSLDKISSEYERANRWMDELKSSDGFKGYVRNNFDSMNEIGAVLYANIKRALENDDAELMHESLQGTTNEAKKLLSSDLGTESSKRVKEMLKRVKDE